MFPLDAILLIDRKDNSSNLQKQSGHNILSFILLEMLIRTRKELSFRLR